MARPICTGAPAVRPACARHEGLRLPGLALLCVCLLSPALSARAQDAPDTGVQGLHVSFAGEFTGTIAQKDDGFFNYTDYENSLTRQFTAQVSGALHLSDRFEVLGEVRLLNEDPSASGLYLRVRPWRQKPVAIQVGRIPPIFGRFAGRGYGQANPLIGTPLAYQYLTTLRSTEIPWGVDSLLAVRGRGWLVAYPAYVHSGSRVAAPGLPVVSSMHWDAGVQVHAEGHNFSVSGALTNGSLSNPRVDDDNGGKQVAGRVTWRVRPGIELGGSIARGAFIAQHTIDALPVDDQKGDFVQQAIGVDAEVSSGYWILRGETIVSRWKLPAVGSPAVTDPVQTIASTLEGRYRLRPGLYVALRGEQLLFSDLYTPTQNESLPWDAPVSRVELGGGYSITRHILGKVTWQYNWRKGVSRPAPREAFLALQVSAWF